MHLSMYHVCIQHIHMDIHIQIDLHTSPHFPTPSPSHTLSTGEGEGEGGGGVGEAPPGEVSVRAPIFPVTLVLPLPHTHSEKVRAQLYPEESHYAEKF